MWYHLNLNKLRTLSIIYSVIYWGVYIINAFWAWDLYNPFWWVLEIPYDESLRGALMFFGALGLFISAMIYNIFLNKYGRFEDQT